MGNQLPIKQIIHLRDQLVGRIGFSFQPSIFFHLNWNSLADMGLLECIVCAAGFPVLGQIILIYQLTQPYPKLEPCFLALGDLKGSQILF